jgi:3-phenylpropionate/trans-cinnamate dioxygenase ferredoxin component
MLYSRLRRLGSAGRGRGYFVTDFVPDFVRVAHVDEVPSDAMTVVELDGHLICLGWVEGHLYAIEDDCTHVGGPLDEGELEGAVLTCPWHLAQFDLRTGRVLRGPAREDLRTYAVRVEGDDVLLERPSADE